MKEKRDREKQLEDAKIRWLKRYTDWVSRQLIEGKFDEASAVEFLTVVKAEILKRFPDKHREYNLIYRRRFARILLRKGVFLDIIDNDSIN